jgi:hypothetical protein
MHIIQKTSKLKDSRQLRKPKMHALQEPKHAKKLDEDINVSLDVYYVLANTVQSVIKAYVTAANTSACTIKPVPVGLPLIAIGILNFIKIELTIEYVIGFAIT